MEAETKGLCRPGLPDALSLTQAWSLSLSNAHSTITHHWILSLCEELNLLYPWPPQEANFFPEGITILCDQKGRISQGAWFLPWIGESQLAVKSLIWHEQHSFTYTCMSWRVVTQYHNSRKKFLWNSQLSKSCRALFSDIFTVKKAIGENNSVTTYNLWHFLPLPFVSKQLGLWSYSFVRSKVRISKSLHKEKKEKNWVTESVEWRSDSQVKEIPLGIC